MSRRVRTGSKRDAPDIDDLEWELAKERLTSNILIRFNSEEQIVEIIHSNSDAGACISGSNENPETGTYLPLSLAFGPIIDVRTDEDRKWLELFEQKKIPFYPCRQRVPVSLAEVLAGLLLLHPLNRWGLT